jgi:hypothetical protein
MKKLLLSIFTVLLLAPLANAQVAKKYLIIEQFTNASCGPCAAGNPAFNNDVILPYTGKTHHVAYHTSWPGTDPMYSHNTAENAARTTYYNVTGVPTYITMGKNNGRPVPKDLDALIDGDGNPGSPIALEVSQEIDGDSLRVKVKVITVNENFSDLTYKLRIAIVERNINYSTPPGSNGEKYFPNVFRKMLPNTTGDDYKRAPKGQFVEYNYAVKIPNPSVWKMNEIYTLAFVQNNTTKDILNCGSSRDEPINISNGGLSVTAPKLFVASSSETKFPTVVSNKGVIDETFRVYLSKSVPMDWDVTFEVDGIAYSANDTVEINIPAGSDIDGFVTIMPGNTPGIGRSTISMVSVDNPSGIVFNKTVKVISKVTDLVVSNSSAIDYEEGYLKGLINAGNTTNAGSNTLELLEGFSNNVLGEIKSIYYNMGWTFPALTDELVDALIPFLNNGGNLFMSGQDIGWAAYEGTGQTNKIKSFFTDYLKAKYEADGAGANSQLKALESDHIFNSYATAAIASIYGAGNLYPDEISPINGSKAILTYNTAAKIAGVRSFDSNKNSKVVYLGVGVEMLNEAARNQLLKMTYDYFYGEGCGAVEVDYQVTNVKCKGDANGSIILTASGASGSNTFSWSNNSNTSSLENISGGTYTLTFTNGSGCSFQTKYTVKESSTLLEGTISSLNASTGSNGSATANPTGGTTPYTYLWMPGNKTTKTISGLTPGDYTVTITDALGCQIEKTVNIVSTVGIDEHNKTIDFSVYPIPSRDKVFVEMELDGLKEVKVSLYDVLGKNIESQKTSASGKFLAAFEINHLPSGVYYVKLEAGDNQYVKKIIVQ